MAKAIISWSSGKDSAWALHEARRAGDLEIVGALTTLAKEHGRVAMHGVREALLDAQMDRVGLPVRKIWLPSPCPNEVYEREMGAACEALVADGVTRVIFGDLFLDDIRAYRERQLEGTGLTPVFPLWGRDTEALAREMIAGGLRATVTSLDPSRVDRAFAGRAWDAALLDALPDDADPCGENGEMHTVVTAGPMFDRPIETAAGEVVERDGFLYADVLLA